MHKLKTKITAIVTFETEEEIENIAKASEALGEHIQETVKEAIPTLFDNLPEETAAVIGVPETAAAVGVPEKIFTEDAKTGHRTITVPEGGQ